MHIKKNNTTPSARKNRPAEEFSNNLAPNMHQPQAHSIPVSMSLTPKYPDPERGFEPLSHLSVITLSRLVLDYMEKLLSSRGATVDTAYWRKTTLEIFSIQDRDRALVVPARAGAGKSTWIIAFLLALCERFLANDPFVFTLGGIMLVLQKVDTLNEILATIDEFFPGQAETFMVAMQGWSKSGQDHDFCPNKHVTGYRECTGTLCPYVASCKVRAFLCYVPQGSWILFFFDLLKDKISRYPGAF